MEHDRDAHHRNNWVRAMDVSPDGKYLVSSSLDDSVRLWETATGREVYRLPGHGRTGGCRAVQFTPDGQQFASWGDDMRANVWDVATGKAVQEFRRQPQGVKLEPEGGARFAFMAADRLEGGLFSPDASTLTVLYSGLRRFTVSTGQELPKIDNQGRSFSMGIATAPNNEFLVSTSWGRGAMVTLKNGGAANTSGKTHSVEVRNLADGELLAEAESEGVGAGPTAFSPDSRLVAIAVIAEQPRIELRKVPDLTEVGRIDLPSRAFAVAFSRSGKLLAASVADSTVLVWNWDELRHKSGSPAK